MIKISDFSAVIFDMDGLVIDTEITYSFAKQQAADLMGHDLPDHYWLSFSGMHQQQIHQKLLTDLGPNFDFLEFNQSSEHIWRDFVDTNGIQVKPGFKQLIDFIQMNQIPFCLATNSNTINAEYCLERAGLADIFRLIISRDDVLHGKPEPDIFLKAADKLNVICDKTMVLEDSPTGVVAATRAGAFTVFVPSTLPADPVSLSLCNVTMPSLQDLLEALSV